MSERREAIPRLDPALAERLILKQRSLGRTIVLRQSRTAFFASIGIFLLAFFSACGTGTRRNGIPSEAQATLDSAIADIDAGRYEKLYNEAADEWRNQATLDGSRATFQKISEKLGRVRTRSLQTAREEQTSTAPIAGHSLTAIYQTSFEHGDGIETFTLVERGGHWYLAKYYVSSSAVK
jgi:Protein of unknown function (DUF4019)